MYKKIIIAVDCETDKEQEIVQRIAKDASEMMRVKASDIIKFYPVFQKNSGLIVSAFRAISAEGMRGIARIVPMFIKNFKS